MTSTKHGSSLSSVGAFAKQTNPIMIGGNRVSTRRRRHRRCGNVVSALSGVSNRRPRHPANVADRGAQSRTVHVALEYTVDGLET